MAKLFLNSRYIQMAVCVCLLVTWVSQSKLLIITPVFNRPDFIEIQYKTFKKFLKDEYEWKIFNDANNPAMEQQIAETCMHLGVDCIRVPQNLHNVDPHSASYRHGESVQFAFEQFGFKHNDIVMLIDSDVFPIHDFSPRQFLGDNDVYVLYDHMMLQLTFINMPKLPNPETINFRVGFLNGICVDAGHADRLYLQAHPELKQKRGTMLWGLHRGAPADLAIDKSKDIVMQLTGLGYTSLEINLIKSVIDFCARHRGNSRVFMDCNIGFFENNLFLDYKHGSGWHEPNPEFKNTKDRIFKEFISNLLNEER